MKPFLQITPKRRENLVKFCLNTYTTVLAGLIIPFALQAQPFRASIFLVAAICTTLLILVAYLLER